MSSVREKVLEPGVSQVAEQSTVGIGTVCL